NVQVRQSLLKAIPILWATIPSDGLDFCLIGQRAKAGEEGILLGLKVQQGRKLDHLVRDAIKNLPTTWKKGFTFQFNHGQHAGARLHRFQFPDDTEDSYLAIRDDVVFLSIGKQALKSVQHALDGFGKTTPPPTPLLQAHALGAFLLPDESSAKAKAAEAVQKAVP